MTILGGRYLFFLGVAAGMTLLLLSAYRRVSPLWLRALLIATALFIISRYVTMALFTMGSAPQQFWALRRCWFATSVGLTLPSLIVIDQLLRHPAMSPAKLLRIFSPFLIAYGAVILFGVMSPQPDPVMGWTPRLSIGWQWFLGAIQTMFVLGFVTTCLLLMRKIPSPPIQRALLGLVIAHAYLGFDGLVLALGRWYFRPFLFSEMVALLALWYAYETSARLQQTA